MYCTVYIIIKQFISIIIIHEGNVRCSATEVVHD